ncbi:helix-turn-helix domain-containing protein [Arthrobacter glacialis]|uniref:HTH-type transcriptional regulator RipA n=1 Tax=Arthrobacter glacialis TaxID=1664 RepID=A0A2S3ZRV8_ARTGL|nr:AraC family transcriptional regulator [Arthrobacter glacialis]POH59761.1 AraC family transcriptional regulator [Arthrobacter glacialis]POH71940.1 AraC family transcriptional regulator [Arthrobacter glacialis]
MTLAPLPDAGHGAWRREPSTVVRQGMSAPASMLDSFVIFAESESPQAPLEWEPHSHLLHELVWVRGGTLTARVGSLVFTVSEGEGLWLPEGQVHAGRLTANVEFHSAFFSPHRTPLSFDGPTVITMDPLLESLLKHLARTDLLSDARVRAESVVFDVLEPSRQQLQLQLPGDTRIDPIAETLLNDPSDGRSLDDWARLLDMSERTITRAFRHATGLSFAQWRRALRVHRALALMSEGWDVRATSEMVGYAQPSSFIAAFRTVLGTTPGAFAGALE